MKIPYYFLEHSVRLSLLVLFICNSHQLSAQCNVNIKYDKVVSGYHSSIAMKTDGSFSVWGQAIQKDGTSDYLVPNDLNSTNYPALTGTALKATIGGAGGSNNDQQILLASDGLYAWGGAGKVLSTSIKSTSTFQKITINSKTDGLPTGVSPTDVNMLIATSLTLVILTNSGNVFVITQADASLQGDSATLSATVWHQVKINSTTNLGSITAIRSEVSSASYGAMVALSSSGAVYTWGKTIYLGNGTASATKKYATLMTLPAEFTSSNIPAMIGVTGGISGTSTTKNTYYLVSNSGALYSLGDNSQKQCGDFSTTERTSWVNAKINASTNFTNISFISPQDHDGAFPGIAAITIAGDLYTWGNNGGNQLGQSTTNTSYDPAIPAGFNSGTDKAVFAELGGHTLVYLKAGSSQFCYVGHKTNGSMGDNISASSYVTSFDCTGTPSINICGYVPVVASVVASTITVSTTNIAADGTSTSLVTVQLKDASGNNLSVSGGNVVISTSAGTLGTVTDNNNGTYNSTLTSSSNPATASITYSINGSAGLNMASVNFLTPLSLKWGEVTATRKNKTVIVEWNTEQESNVAYFIVQRSMDAMNWDSLGDKIYPANHPGRQKYSEIDFNYLPDVLYYRITEVDLNGRYSYSLVIEVRADISSNKLILYPTPAFSKFYLESTQAAKIMQVQVFNVSGNMIKTWSGNQVYYDITTLTVGLYNVRILLEDGTMQMLKLQKL